MPVKARPSADVCLGKAKQIEAELARQQGHMLVSHAGERRLAKPLSLLTLRTRFTRPCPWPQISFSLLCSGSPARPGTLREALLEVIARCSRLCSSSRPFSHPSIAFHCRLYTANIRFVVILTR